MAIFIYLLDCFSPLYLCRSFHPFIRDPNFASRSSYYPNNPAKGAVYFFPTVNIPLCPYVYLCYLPSLARIYTSFSPFCINPPRPYCVPHKKLHLEWFQALFASILFKILYSQCSCPLGPLSRLHLPTRIFLRVTKQTGPNPHLLIQAEQTTTALQVALKKSGGVNPRDLPVAKAVLLTY